MAKTFKQMIASDRLPSLPQVALRVIQLAREPEPDFDEVIRTVRTDPALSSKMLRTTNSALFGLGRPMQSIEAAIPMLGMTLVRTIVLGFTLAKRPPNGGDIHQRLQALWRCSLTQAVFAESLAMEVPGADPPTYFLAGLLQDIGILAALHVDPEDYTTHVWDVSDFPNVIASERQFYGFTHLEIARELLRRWGIPDEVRDAIAVHHRRMQTEFRKSTRDLTIALQAANLCAQYVENAQNSSGRYFDDLVGFVTEHYHWSIEKTEEALRDTVMRVGETAALYSFDVGKGYSTEDILDEAKRILEEIALHSQLDSIVSTKQLGGTNNAKSRRQIRKLEEEIMQDALTGTYNRRFMDQVLNERLSHDIMGQKPMGFLFLDIDKFKSINDLYGHQVGDEAVRHIADIITEAVRTSDFVIRYGGDEFLVTLVRVSDEELEQIATRIRLQIRKSKLDGHPAVRMTCSVGALHYQPKSGDTLDANWLIDHVDKAMYEAKNNGGDQVRLYRVSSDDPSPVVVDLAAAEPLSH